MDYVLDTVGLLRHLAGDKKLGKAARAVLDEADKGVHHIIVSAISLMEILYLSERGKIKASLKETIELISKSANYKIHPVDAAVVQAAAEIDDVPELHDRVIAGTAKFLNVPLITPDRVLRGSKYIKALW